MHKACKRLQDAENGVDINLAQKKGLQFYQTRSNSIILYDTLSTYCIPKAIMMGTGEVIYEKVHASPRQKELKEINNGHRVHLFLPHGGVGKVLGGLLIPMIVTMEINQVLIEQGDLLYKYLGTSLQGMIFLNSFTLLQMDPLQLTASTVTDGECKYHTSNDMFPRCKTCAQNGYRKK